MSNKEESMEVEQQGTGLSAAVLAGIKAGHINISTGKTLNI